MFETIEKMKTVFICLFESILLSLCCCAQVLQNDNEEILRFPNNKVWAHRVNDTVTALDKEKWFDGMEIDIVYSAYQNKLFVCHDDGDTAHNLTLETWFSALKSPKQHYYWLDVKNLNDKTADSIACKIKNILNTYGIIHQAFIESPNEQGVRIVKNHHLHTSLWVEHIQWSYNDTTRWYNKTSRQIDEIHPDCISSEYNMFDLLTEKYPEQNILLWHTPALFTSENAALTRKLCQHPSVKIVLVDYEKPVDY